MNDKGDVNSYLDCPYCRGTLRLEEQNFTCSNCKKKYPIVNSIPNFCEEEGYWCNVSKEKMQRLNTKARKSGDWLESAKEIIPEYLGATEPFSRADTQFLLPIDNNSRVLDAGSMWGGLTIPIAQYCKEIFAVDKTMETLSFLKIRAEQMGFENIYPVASSLDKLPFSDNYFDIVIVNGVLEWVGFKQNLILEKHWHKKREDRVSYQKSPKSMQIEVLQELQRVLKPNGYLYLAIENRIGYQYLTGFPDDHVNIKFVTFLPRVLANLITKWKRGCEYRTYIYTKFGYENLLNKTGFKNTEFFGAFPHYINPKKVISFEIMQYFKNTITYGEGKRINFFFKPLPNFLAKYFSPSILAIAQKNPGRQQRNSRIIDLLIESELLRGSKSDNFEVIITGSRPSNYLTANYIVYDKNKREQIYFCKICRSRDYIDALKDEADNLKVINFLLKGSGIEDSVPQLLYYGTIDNITILVSNFIEGRKFILSEISKRSLKKLDIVIQRGIKFLVKFQKLTEVAKVEVSSYLTPLIKKQWAILQDKAKMDEGIELNLKNLIEEIENLEGIEIPLCAIHGDYDLCNLLFREKDIAVVDFEHFEIRGFPLFDLANLIFNVLIMSIGKTGDNISFLSTIKKYNLESYLKKWLNQYSEISGISPRALSLIAPIAMLEQKTKKYPYYRDPATYPINQNEFFKDLISLRVKL